MMHRVSTLASGALLVLCSRMMIGKQRLDGLIVVLLLTLLAVLLFVPMRGGVSRRDLDVSQARQDVRGLVTALRAYKTEYGRFPAISAAGEREPARRNAELLEALSGIETPQNPRKIVFFEGRNAQNKRGMYRSGLDPVDGTLLDPWGNPYHVRFNVQGEPEVESPYADEGGPLRVGVIVWSLGPDGKEGRAGNPADSRSSDDITSWR